MAMRINPTIITMTNPALIKLMTWLSPAFPIGGFSYSGGLEAACQSGQVHDQSTLKEWIECALSHGPVHTDTVILSTTYRNDLDIDTINQLALSLCVSKERYEETIALGDAFIQASQPWRSVTSEIPDTLVYPCAIGLMAKQNNIPLQDTLNAFLQSFVSHQIQAALRLIKLGQQGAMALQHDLEPLITEKSESAKDYTMDNLGTCAILMDHASMAHETLPSRIFRS